MSRPIKLETLPSASRQLLPWLLPLAPLFLGISQCSLADADQDGWTTDQGDCNDQDPSVYPGADARFYGEAENDRAGNSVSSAGDVNHDGYADLLIGAPNASDGVSRNGAAYLIFGPVQGAHSLSSAPVRLTGEALGDIAGASVSSAGDTQADGCSDLLIGAPYSSDGIVYGGAAYVVSGGGP